MSKQIPLSQGLFAIVDDEDYEWLNSFTWCAVKTKKSNTYYAQRRVGNKFQFMHQMIFQKYNPLLLTKKIVDHKNLNGIDNRKENIRPSSYSQNCANVPKKKKNGTSKYKGVTYQKDIGKWRARIKKDYKNINIGTFNTEIEAAEAYNKIALELFGEFAYLNSFINQ